MKNKSFVGIDISKKVIDVSIFREDTNIKMFPHEVFNNTRKGFGDMCSWLKKSRVVLSQALFGMEFNRLLLLGLGKIPHVQELLFLYA